MKHQLYRRERSIMQRGPFPQRRYGTPFPEGVGGVKHQLYRRERSIMQRGPFPQRRYGTPFPERVLGCTSGLLPIQLQL